jgi:chemotaxis protein MotA
MQLATFYDPLALALVGGGTALTTVLRTPAADLARAIAALPMLARRRFSAAPLLEQLAAQARIAKRHGVIALDHSVIADPDLAAGLAAIVDGAGPEDVTALMDERRQARLERHAAAIDAWRGAAEAAPAMGMVGTLIGLAAMFAGMRDPQAIGGAMAVALLATLYGALLGNLLLQPIAQRLANRARTEAFERSRLVRPLAVLAEREAPRLRPAHAA